MKLLQETWEKIFVTFGQVKFLGHEFHERFFENSTSSKLKAFDLQINDTIKQSSHSIEKLFRKLVEHRTLTFSNKLISLVFKK